MSHKLVRPIVDHLDSQNIRRLVSKRLANVGQYHLLQSCHLPLTTKNPERLLAMSPHLVVSKCIRPIYTEADRFRTN